MITTNQKFVVSFYAWSDYDQGEITGDIKSREMTLEEMLATTSEELCFEAIILDEDTTFTSTELSTYKLADVAKYLLTPYLQMTLKYPVAVYVTLLNDQCCNGDLDRDAEDYAGIVDGVDYNLTNIVPWVEKNLIRYDVNQENFIDIYTKFHQARVDYVLTKIKTTMGEEFYRFLQDHMELVVRDSVEDAAFLDTTLQVGSDFYSVLCHLHHQEDDYAKMFNHLKIA